MSEYQINFGPESATDWLGANSPARFAARAAIAIDFNANFPVSIARYRGWWFAEGEESEKIGCSNEIIGEEAVHSAIARLEKGGPGLVTFKDVYGFNPWNRKFDYTPRDETVDNVAFVNDWLANTRVRKAVGTNGDWDMVLKSFIVIMYRYRHRLRPEVYHHVLHNLLNQRGAQNPRQLIVFPIFLETENHVLMIETSRYLTNQLLYLEGWERGEHRAEFDNRLNGLTNWLLTRLLKIFLQYDFWEFNSKPYQRLSMAALQNLIDFSWDEPVKTAARMVLDYVSAKTAVSSNGLRRSVPFRRMKDYIYSTHLFGHGLDAQTSRMLMLSGMTEQLAFVHPKWHAHIYSADTLLVAALTTYRVPEIVLDILMNKRRYTYYQRFFHGNRYCVYCTNPERYPGKGPLGAEPIIIPGGIEIYANNEDVLLSAGGAFFASGNSDFDEFDDYDSCAHAVPTTLMPRYGIDRADFIQIVGEPDLRDRINTGVLPGFACGFNLWIPPFYRRVPSLAGPLGEIEFYEGYYEKFGNWTFINASDDSPNPAARFGFHVAIHTQSVGPDWADEWSKQNFGFFEVAPSRLRKFSEFRDLVLRRNSGRSYDHMVNLRPWFEYDTTDGRHIRFTWPPDDKLTWCILSVNGVPAETNIGGWPLARGEIINSRRNPYDAAENGRAGWLSIDNPYFQQRLVLDMRDPLIPRRYQYRKNARRHTAGALATRDVFRLDAFWSGPDGDVRRIAWDAYVHEGARWSFPIPLTPPVWTGRMSPLISVARTSEHLDVFWLRGDGSIWSCWWSANDNSREWSLPFAIPLGNAAGEAARTSGLAVLSPDPDHVDLFWIARDGSVWTHWWSGVAPDGDWSAHSAFPISPPQNASISSNIVATSRTGGHVDVFWADSAGRIWSAWWDANGGWRPPFAITGSGEAAENCHLSANSRHSLHVDLFWVSPRGAVRHTWWHPDFNNGRWNSVGEVAPAGAASPEAGIASVSRVREHVDVFWVASSGAIMSRFWSDMARPLAWSPTFAIAPPASARSDSPLHVVSRDPGKLDLLWVGPEDQLVAHWWDGERLGGLWHEHQPFAITPHNAVRSAKQVRII